jgi:NDP-sugar pyrophosphorylase family protein
MAKLTKEQIETLIKNRCYADDWNKIQVADGIKIDRLQDCVFKGEIKIGKLAGRITLEDGIERVCGIYRAKLNNVSIGDNCYIADVRGWISNADIDDGVVIENVGDIKCTEETTFGNGVPIEVLNEGGGRELKITKNTSAQIAYLNVLYRDKKNLIEKLDKIADKFAKAFKRKRVYIGKEARIINSLSLINVYVGEAAEISGAQHLEEGTIDSSKEAPSVVGNGVVAEKFIIQKGASVKEGAMVFSSLVGEGTKIGEQFSAKASVFFANSEGFHSESCSAFCGPYSVSHHRSTLLIAGLFSFYNAGSGTNQSNHMYKLGPIHQGILERGCKTGSFSYLLWPSKVGAFSVVIGKHYANFDTSDLPFSYITDEDGKSIITPATNFFTVGTVRDVEKWLARDRRKNKNKLDLIIFDVLSPFTGQKMIRAVRILQELYDKTAKGEEYVKYNGINIKRVLLKTNKKYYQLILSKYFGDVLLKRMKKTNASKISEILKTDSKGVAGNNDWVDICGLLCTRERVNKLIADIENEKINDFEKLQNELEKIYNSYEADEWNWVLVNYKEYTGKEIKDDIESLLASWKEASIKFYDMVLNDAKKEFVGKARTGFGIDGNQDADFEAVRGKYETNKFVKQLLAKKEEVEKIYNDLKTKI